MPLKTGASDTINLHPQLVKFTQPPVSPPVGIGLRIFVLNLFRVTQKVKTLMRQRVHRALLKIPKHERRLPRVPALL